MKNEINDDNKQDKMSESIDGHKRLKAVKANPINSLNLSRESSLNGKKPAQPDKGKMMTFFSNKPKETAILPRETHPKMDDNVTVPKK